MKEKILAKLIAFAALIINFTLRKKILNDNHYYPKPAIYAFFHSVEFSMLIFNRFSGIVIMVSKSKDGDIMANLLDSFGYEVIRGSSSKGAERALIEMIKVARTGKSSAYAVDGPRGPFHIVKAGVVYAALKTGFPVIPVSCSPKNKIVLKKSWDKLRIPLPFSKDIQICGNPIFVNADDNIEEKRLEVESELLKLFDFTEEVYWGDDIAKYLEYHPFPKILIVQPSRIGDIIFSLPVLAAIKKKYPKARISWIVDERCAEILEGNPYISKLFIWDRKNKSLKYYRKLRKELRKEKFDLSIDLHGLMKSAMLVKFANAKYKIASSSTNGMREFSWLFSKEIKSENKDDHCIERHMQIAKHLKCDSDIEYPINISDDAFESVKKKLADLDVSLDKVIGVHAGGGWLSRRWESSKFAQLIKKLKEELGADIVLVGGKEGGSSEKGLNEKIIKESNVNVADMTGKFTLKELCAFFKICKVFVGNEAGPMHIATALNTPAVAILGPTNAKRTGPYNKSQTTIIQHKVDCQPCRNRNCKNIICMQNVSVDEVFNAVKNKYENFNN